MGVCALITAGSSTLAMEVIRLSSGQTVQAPPTSAMTCDEIARKLFEIDDTGYRGPSPLPIDPRDIALLEYEKQVAAARLRRCSVRLIEPAPAAGPARVN